MKETISELIQSTLKTYLSDKGVEVPQDFNYDLVVTKDPTHGDFASNVAMKLARFARRKPQDIAGEFADCLTNHAKCSMQQLDHVEVAGAGFINFYLTKTGLAQILLKIQTEQASYGKSDYGQGKKVLMEFVSANPTGPLTIAHGRQAAIGDSLVRILNAVGFDVTAEYYLNDAGRQMRLLGESMVARLKQAQGVDAALPEEGYQGAYLLDIAKQLNKEKGKELTNISPDELMKIARDYAKTYLMKDIEEDLEKISVTFDNFFSESSLYQNGAVEKVFDFLEKKNMLYEKDGALWFASSEFGDDKDRVVRKSDGEKTYLAPDMAYHKSKFDRGFQRLVNFMGPDHHGYVGRLKAACQALGYDADNVQIRIVQLTTLYRKGEPVRMSTRAGEFVTLNELVDEVGADAARFFFVMRRVDSHLDFDLELAKEKSQENPVYYLQYAYARVSGLLRHAEKAIKQDADLELLKTKEESEVMKRLSDYPKSLIGACDKLEPCRLVDYLRELAAAYHKCYSQHRVVTDNEALTDARLLLAESTRIVLRNGLQLLGISQPESM